jgi:hypothetical protein
MAEFSDLGVLAGELPDCTHCGLAREEQVSHLRNHSDCNVGFYTPSISAGFWFNAVAAGFSDRHGTF